MNDHEMEQRLRAWYLTEIDGAPAAPMPLRAMVHAIPQSTPRRSTAQRRMLLMAAALAVVGAGAVIAAGSGLLHLPNDPPVPPSLVAVATPQPTATEPAPTAPPGPRIEPAPTTSLEPGFRAVDDMMSPRWQHSATLLADGRVLLAGGSSLEQAHLGTSEIWDPVTESFTVGQPMVVPRFGHDATLLRDGRVLIVGGLAAGGGNNLGTRQLELWDPATERFRAAGMTARPRSTNGSMVLLRDGSVLIIDGVDCGPRTPQVEDDAARELCRRGALTAEIWDPETETTRDVGATEEEHDWASATLLDDGRVFLLGGGGLPTIGSEIWDPSTETWSRGGAPDDARMGGQSATLLLDGRVLVVGGQTGELQDFSFLPPLRSIDIWDPATSSFTASGPLQIGRERHTATILRDGRVLIVGGVSSAPDAFSDIVVAEAEIWDPSTGVVTSAGQSATGRGLHTATRLSDGRVLITGGFTETELGDLVADTASVEIWGR